MVWEKECFNLKYAFKDELKSYSTFIKNIYVNSFYFK